MPAPATLFLETPAATERLAHSLAQRVRPPDCILLSGPIGAGKTHFARALIQSRLVALGRSEDVPSPTFTLVQVYEDDGFDIWHADLYRLTSADELVELGIEEAFESALTLIEWPDRLGSLTPDRPCRIDLQHREQGRAAAINWDDPRLDAVIGDMRDAEPTA